MSLKIFSAVRMGWVLLVLTLLAALVGCGGGGGGGNSGGGGGGGGGNGQVDIFMADAPPDPTITSVEVDINRVDVFVGGSWVAINSQSQSHNLLDLRVTPVQIASGSVLAGNYTQVRLVISACRITDSEGTHDATIPGGAPATVVVALPHTVTANQTTTLLLDFNVERSIIKVSSGIYILAPIIPAVVMNAAGTVTGRATDGTNALVNAKVWAIYESGPHYQQNWPVNNAASRADGNAKIWALMPGTYRLEFTWTDGSSTRSAIVNNVTVTAGANTDVGDVTLN
jgi:hypothetical protein